MKRRTFLWTSALAALGTLLALPKRKPIKACVSLPGMTQADVPNVNGIVIPRAEVEKIPGFVKSSPVPVIRKGRTIGTVQRVTVRNDGGIQVEADLTDVPRGLVFGRMSDFQMCASFTCEFDEKNNLTLHSIGWYELRHKDDKHLPAMG